MVRVAIAGAHGKIARRLTGWLVGRGDTVIGLIRNPAHAEDIHQDVGPTLAGEANLLICPNLDSANILFNVLKITGASDRPRRGKRRITCCCSRRIWRGTRTCRS